MNNYVLRRRINTIIIVVFGIWIIVSTSVTLFKLYPEMYKLQMSGNKKAIENMINDLDKEITNIDKLMFRENINERHDEFLNESQFNIRGFINIKTGEAEFNTSNSGEFYIDSFKRTLNEIIGIYNFNNGITIGYLKEKIPFMLFIKNIDNNMYQVGVIFLDGEGSFRLDKNSIGENLKIAFFPIDSDTSNFENINIKSNSLGDIYKKSYSKNKGFINNVYIKDYKDDISLELVYDFDQYGKPYLYESFIKYGVLILFINIAFALIILFVLDKSVFLRIDNLNKKISNVLNKHGVKEESKLGEKGIIKDDEITSISKDITMVTDYIEFCNKKADFYYKKDRLTGLNKLDTFLEVGRPFLISKNRCAIIYINLEGIGVLNYNLGFESGNALMRHSVMVLQKIIPDGIWTRISGLELAVLFQYEDSREVEKYCEKMIRILNSHIELKGKQYFISCNIGAALLCNEDKDLDLKLSRAYMAMAKAREKAINTYYILNYDIKNNISVSMLQDAMKNNEFKLYYQPKVDCKTLKIIGVEALIRWKSPKYGFISPDKFISVAEKSGYITTLGKWILKEAAKDMNHFYQKTQNYISLGINVSAIQLLENYFINDIKEIFESAKYPLNILELEITENMSINRFNGVRELIKLARNIGISIAIDDFGTGYSNLKYLKDYRVDTIKLDKSLIENMNENRLFIKSVINIIKSIGAKSVAEGVETLEEVELLRQYECDIIQGYYFYKPMPLEDLIKLMKK